MTRIETIVVALALCFAVGMGCGEEDAKTPDKKSAVKSRSAKATGEARPAKLVVTKGEKPGELVFKCEGARLECKGRWFVDPDTKVSTLAFDGPKGSRIKVGGRSITGKIRLKDSKLAVTQAKYWIQDLPADAKDHPIKVTISVPGVETSYEETLPASVPWLERPKFRAALRGVYKDGKGAAFPGDAAAGVRGVAYITVKEKGPRYQRKKVEEIKLFGDVNKPTNIGFVAVGVKGKSVKKSCGTYRNKKGTVRSHVSRSSLNVKVYDRKTGEMKHSTVLKGEMPKCPTSYSDKYATGYIKTGFAPSPGTWFKTLPAP